MCIGDSPYTLGDYLAPRLGESLVSSNDPAFVETERQVAARTERYLSIRGSRSVDWFHRELGKVLWEHCGMERSADGLRRAISDIDSLKEEFDRDLRVLGASSTLNQSLEKAGRVDDFLQLARLMCVDALHREESCGGHFRVEHQTEDGEARRDDANFSYAAAWGWTDGDEPVLHQEPLAFEYVKPTRRSYK